MLRHPVLTAFGASKEVTELASAYWVWFLPAAMLEPLAFFLGTLAYADGDARLSLASYCVQLVGNCLVSVPLTIYFGAAGCAVGTGIGSFLAIVVLLFHFCRRGCMLGFSRHFSVFSDLMLVFRTSLGDASKNVGKAARIFALNAYVIAHFGSEMLPVLAVVVMTIGISEVFDGVANAAQPLASVYIGERNSFLTKRVMRAALRMALGEGAAAMLVLLAYPNLILMMAGVSDPAVVPAALFAVRIASIALPGLALVLLFNSYYVFIGRETLATLLTLAAVLVVPAALFPAMGSAWGARGVWAALGLAPLVSLAVFAVYEMVRWGFRIFPFLLQGGRDAALRVFDLELDPQRRPPHPGGGDGRPQRRAYDRPPRRRRDLRHHRCGRQHLLAAQLPRLQPDDGAAQPPQPHHHRLQQERFQVMRTLWALAIVALAGCSGSEGRVDPRIADKSRPLVMLTHPTEPPCSYRSESGELIGSDVDLARRIAAKAGRELVVEAVEFSDILPRLKAGTADIGISTITITEARKRDVDFSIPYAFGGACFLYRSADPRPRLSHIASLRIGAEADTVQDIYLCRHGCDPARFVHLEEAVDALDRKAVDAVFFDDMPLKALAEKSGGRYAVSPLATRDGYGVAVDKRRPDVLAAANAVIAEGGAK